MEHLPKLQFFKCKFTLKVAAQMFKECQDPSQQLAETGIRQLRLMDLRFEGGLVKYKKGDLEAAIKLCPSVVHVKIDAAGEAITDEELKPLLNLKNLHHIFVQIRYTKEI